MDQRTGFQQRFWRRVYLASLRAAGGKSKSRLRTPLTRQDSKATSVVARRNLRVAKAREQTNFYSPALIVGFRLF